MRDDRRAVKTTYDRIAGHFSQTRAHPWPEVEEFLADADRAEVAADLGCGNGRHLPVLSETAELVLGLDASLPLLREAEERADETTTLLQGDVVDLPLSDDSLDLAIYVATLHHVPEAEARVRSLDELERVLSPDGVGLVSAWSTEHDRFDATEGFDTTVDWTLPDGETVPRFYHVYDPDEFETALGRSTLEVVDWVVSSGNCYARVTVDD